MREVSSKKEKLLQWLAFPATLEALRQTVLRLILVVILVAATFLIQPNLRARPESLWPALVAWVFVAGVFVGTIVRPAWCRYWATAFLLSILLLEHILGGQYEGQGIRPGLVMYPAMLFMTAFFGSGRLLAVMGLGLAYELFRYPAPSDPVLAVMWSNCVGAFVLSLLVATTFWFGVARLERTQREQQERLKASLSTQSALVAALFHDVANPLMALSGELELAQMDDSDHLELAAVEEPIKQIGAVVEAARAIVALERQLVPEHLQRVSVADAISVGVQTQLREVKAKNIQLHIDAAPDLYAIGHRQVLAVSILGNLISNAVKFCPAGGKVSVVAHETGGQVHIEVANSGGPMPAQLRLRLLEGTNTSSSEGTFGERGSGLGLQIVRDFVQRLSGELHLENREDVVVARVVLPAAQIGNGSQSRAPAA